MNARSECTQCPPLSSSNCVGYRYQSRVREDTGKKVLVDTSSIFATLNLSFSIIISMKITGCARGWRAKCVRYDISKVLYCDISYRNFRYLLHRSFCSVSLSAYKDGDASGWRAKHVRYDIPKIRYRYDISKVRYRYDISKVRYPYDISKVRYRYDTSKRLIRYPKPVLKQVSIYIFSGLPRRCGSTFSEIPTKVEMSCIKFYRTRTPAGFRLNFIPRDARTYVSCEYIVPYTQTTMYLYGRKYHLRLESDV